jgi:transcription elongation factor Elf1
LKEYFNQISKIKMVIDKLKETKKCPNCNFEGSMECWKTIGTDEIYCKCPNCKFTFRNTK